MRRPVYLVIFLFILLIIVVIGALFYIFEVPNANVSTASNQATSTVQALTIDELAASSTVAAFGAEEQQVSLLAPDASTTIATDYGRYVDPTLLAQWEANPQSAPGRVASSPWPASIVVGSITQTDTGYQVQGTLVLQSSATVGNGGYDEEDPLLIDLQDENGVWMISGYQDLSGQQ